MNWEREAASRLPQLLSGWLRAPVQSVKPGDVSAGFDLALCAQGQHFVVEVRGSDDLGILERAVASLRGYKDERAVRLVVVPYMGPKARTWAAQRGVSWVDLSGNAEIRGQGLCVIVSGAENQYAQRGRPSNPFTARYSRVSRALLSDEERWWKQVELAEELGLPTGTVSKVIQRLEAMDLLERKEQGLRARSPSLLLDSWAQRYQLVDHSVRRYHIVVRSGEEGLRTLVERLEGAGTRYAATGLSAAWLYTGHAGFRLNTFFVDQHPSDPEALGLRPTERGENVWLLVPNDEGVFYRRERRGAWCVHPVQVYLDLASQPERAQEAAQELRARCLRWRA